MDRALWIIGLAIFWVAMIGLMYVGWRGRARRQKDKIGELPTVPATLGELLVLPTTGLYVGSTIAPSWQDRIAVGDSVSAPPARSAATAAEFWSSVTAR